MQQKPKMIEAYVRWTFNYLSYKCPAAMVTLLYEFMQEGPTPLLFCCSDIPR